MNIRGSVRLCFGSSVFACAATLSLVAASSQAQQQKQLATRHVHTEIFSGKAVQAGELPQTQQMQFSIILPLRNQAGLNDLLARLYDPSSPSYRHFLSVAEFTQQFGPTADEYQQVVDFAAANGFAVTHTHSNRLVVNVKGSVAQIEKAFNVSMKVYRHPTENRTFYSMDREPSTTLGVPLWHIGGLDNYSIPRPALNKPQAGPLKAPVNATGSGPGGSYLPKDMRAAYYGGTALTGAGQSVGLVEFEGYNLSDVALNFGGAATATATGVVYTPTAGKSYTIAVNSVPLDGASATPSGSDPDGEAEAALDISQPIGMAPGLSSVNVYIAPLATIDPTNTSVGDVDIFEQMAENDTENQLSCSWNWRPADPAVLDPIFQELAAQGQTLIIASGDYGSWPNSAYYYPEEDAYVTAVGGTDLATNGTGGSWASETAWVNSGGGISPDNIGIPSWQSALNGVNGASKTLRNAPDVAAEANQDNYSCSFGSCQSDWGGTSFAAPRWAGFLALVNQQALASGEATVGFLNPTVYSIGEGASYHSDFHDITSGSNGSYTAAAGYDLVTGWGSPNAQMIDALAPPPTKPVALMTITIPGGALDGNSFPSGPQDLTGNVSCNAACGSVTLVMTKASFGNYWQTTAQLDGNGNFSAQTPFLSSGAYRVTGTYSGNSEYGSSVAVPYSFSVYTD